MDNMLTNHIERAKMIARFSPVLYFHPEEKYFPGNVEDYLAQVRLRLDRGGGSDIAIIDPVGNESKLLAHDNEGQHSSGNYPSRYFLEIIDHNKDKTRQGNLDNAKCYVLVRATPGREDAWDIVYMFFYPYNGNLGRFGAHEGDWEHITVRVNASGKKIEKIYYSAHYHEGNWYYPLSEKNPNGFSIIQNTHPVVHVAKDSHASYPTAGTKKRSTNNLPDPGLASILGNSLPDDQTAKNGTVGKAWSCESCPVDLIEKKLSFLRYSGLWGEVGPSFSGPHGPAFQSWWKDDDSCQLTFNSSIKFCNRNNSCSDVIFNTTDDAGQVITEKLRRGFINDQVRSLKLKNVSKGRIITLYDSPDGKKDDDWTQIEILERVDYYFLDTLEVTKTDPVVCVTANKDNGLDGKVSRIVIS